MHFAPDSATAAVAALAEKLTELGPAEHGFTHLALDAAAVHAAELDQLPPARRGRLHGQLIPIKDLSDVSGMPTSLGSVRRTYLPKESAPLVQWLLSEGAVIPGKTATPELGMSAYTEPVGMLPPVNPLWPDQQRTPGGSSGGAAVAVARGLVDIAHASDGGGSIRIPAAACGLVGFKPAHAALGGALSAQGVLTRSVATTARVHGLALDQPPAALRIGLMTRPLFAETAVDPARLAAVSRVADLLSDLGHEVVELSPEVFDAGSLFAAFRAVFSAKVAKIPGPASALVEWCREIGADGAPDQAIQRLEGSAGEVARAWEVDVLLSPMLAWDPPEIGFFSQQDPAVDFHRQTQWTPWGSLFNMTGAPAISLPLANPGQRPLSAQLGGIRVTESQLLNLAAQVEAEWR